MSDSAPPPPPPHDPYGQSPYGQSGYAGAGSQPGGVGARIGARIIDFIIINIVVRVVTKIVLGTSGTGTDIGYGKIAAVGVITAVILLAYFALSEATQGQTLGKRLTKLHVVGPDGQNPSIAAAAKRNLWVALPVLTILGGVGVYLYLLVYVVVVIVLIVQVANESTGRVTFMDKFAGGTRVVVKAA